MTDRHAGWRSMSAQICLVFTSKWCHTGCDLHLSINILMLCNIARWMCLHVFIMNYYFYFIFSHRLHRLTVKTAFPMIPWLYTVSMYLSLAHYIVTGWWVSISTPVSFKFLYTAFLMYCIDTTITVLLLYLCPIECACKGTLIQMWTFNYPIFCLLCHQHAYLVLFSRSIWKGNNSSS